MNETHEDRIAYLEMVLDAQVKLNAVLMPMILRHDDRFRGEVAEVLRQALVSPATKLSPLLEHHIRTLTDGLALPSRQEGVESSRQSGAALERVEARIEEVGARLLYQGIVESAMLRSLPDREVFLAALEAERLLNDANSLYATSLSDRQQQSIQAALDVLVRTLQTMPDLSPPAATGPG